MKTKHTSVAATLCRTPLRLALVSAFAASGFLLPGIASADDAALSERINQLEAQIKEMQTQIGSLRDESAKNSAATANGESAPSRGGAQDEDTRLFSYGEINYSRPVHNTDAAQADVRRVVLGYQHRFDEKTKALVELEYEHAVTSADDPGESEVEQAYVEHAFNSIISVKGGLFLIPMGLLNEHHEPTAYYGVERNFVESAIIPTTWREGGFNVIASLDNGITVQGGLSTSFDLGKWDGTSTEGQESPLASVHQELALAKAKDAALFAALDWRGIPGLQLGASIFGGPAGQDNPLLGDANVLIWDTHARWTPGKWDLSALYARGTISNSEAFNTSIIGNVSLIPELFDGYYAQAAYRAWENDEYSVSPFARYETYNTGASYAGIGAGVTPAALPDNHVSTIGANIGIGKNVVVKVDGQRFRPDSNRDRFDLGIGWSF